MDYNKLWKILKEMGIPDHLTCLRNLYTGQEATARTGHGTTNWFHVGLYEALTAIKIVGRNISNLRYADGTTLMAESEEDLKSILMRMKEESEKAGLKLNIKKLRPWHPAPSYHGKQMGEKWKQWQTLFSWAPKSPWTVTAAMKLKDTCSLEGKL